MGMRVAGWIDGIYGAGLSEDCVWRALGWALVVGVLGARLYHVVDLWDYYALHPREMIAIWNGGLGIYGGLLGGLLGLWLYSKRTGSKLFELLDFAAFSLPMSQAIGRWGNYLNQELYGRPTSLPWGIYIDSVHRVAGYELAERFHPLFLYESLGMLVVFGVLYWLVRRGYFAWGYGYYLAVYLIGYGVVRGLLEGFRISPWSVGGMPVALLLSLTIVAWGIGWLYVKRAR